MLTLVAESITPKNQDCKFVKSIITPAKYPKNNGTIIPPKPTKVDDLPERLNSPRSVSKPAININKITPIVLNVDKVSVAIN